jgi:hypothetical protein
MGFFLPRKQKIGWTERKKERKKKSCYGKCVGDREKGQERRLAMLLLLLPALLWCYNIM